MNVKMRKLLSLVLAFVMVLGMFPATVFAVGEAAGRFVDVPADAWYNEAVQYVYEKGLMNGFDETHFAPGATTTRSMVVTVLHRMEDEPAGAGVGFTDVEDGQWYTEAVLWAQANGIVEGDGDGTFRPHSPMTREEMVVVFYRYSDFKGYNITNGDEMGGFEDGSTVGSYAEEAMSWAISVGLIHGFEDGTIRPRASCERVELATVLMRFHRTFPIPIYMIRYNSNGGSAVASQAVYTGEYAYRPADPVREGYVFENWYQNEALTELYDFNQPVLSDITLYAKWVNLDVQIELDAGEYDDNIVNRTVTGSIQHNIAIESITWELSGANKTESGEIALEDAYGFAVDVMLEDGENVFTVTVATVDGSVISESIVMNFDSGYVYDSGEVYDENDERLIKIPIETDEEGNPTTYLVANILSLYFYDFVAYEERESFITETLGGEVAGYLNSLDMMQILLPNPAPKAAEIGYTGETNLTQISEDEIWEYADALAAAYGDILESVDPEHIYVDSTLTITTNDPWGNNTNNDWWLEAIDAYDAWEYDDYYNLDYLTDSTTLGVMDNGFLTTHEDLRGNVKVISKKDTVDDHGTHVSGIIVAEANNGTGIAGVTYNNGYLYAYDVDGNFSDSTINEAMTKLVENGAKVINFSMGRAHIDVPANSSNMSASKIKNYGKTYSKYMGKLLAKGNDFIIVESAGNGNKANIGVDYWNNGFFCSINSSNCYSSNGGLFSDAISKQEIIDRIVIVAAVDSSNSLTSFSNGNSGGSLNIIAAPGDSIYSTSSTGNSAYVHKSGTSMSAPIVTGVCGLVWSVNTELSGAQVVDLVMNNNEGTAATNTASRTTGGMGIVNAKKAVEAAINTRPTYYGTVLNALNGEVISSASVVIHADGPDGPVVGKEQVYYTNGSGVFTAPKLPADIYWLEVTAEGYLPGLFYMNAWSNENRTINLGTVGLTPEMDPNEYRIILSWTSEPSDLDSHMVANLKETGEDFHVWYSDRDPYPYYANLDRDDTSYEGPETVTITHFSELKNIRYAVHDYTNRSSSSSKVLSNSGATVNVWKGSELIETFHVPKNTPGTEWDVFAIDAEGKIIPINQMKFCENPGYVLNGDAAGADMEIAPMYLKEKADSE